jgi:hypothetical protein
MSTQCRWRPKGGGKSIIVYDSWHRKSVSRPVNSKNTPKPLVLKTTRLAHNPFKAIGTEKA